MTQYVIGGGQAIPPEDPTKDGYRFTGWLPSSLTVNADTDFVAQYTALEKLHVSITYKYAAGTSLAGQTAAPSVDQYFDKIGYTTQTFTSPAVQGYVPSDASKSVAIGQFNTTNEFTFAVTYALSGNVAYSVKHMFEKAGIVGDPGPSDYDLNTTTPSTAMVFSTVTAAPLATYTGFYIKQQESGTISSSGNTVLKVFYNRKLIALTFETSGGTYIDPIVGKYQKAVTVPANPTKLGYTFAGWFSNAGLTVPATIPSAMPADDAHFYAKWTAKQVDYTAIYWLENANDTNYSYEKTVIKQASAGSSITLNASSAGTIPLFTFGSSTTVTIAGDGSSVINVYFTRNLYTLTFKNTNNNTFQTITRKYDAITSDLWPVPGHEASVWRSSVTQYYYSSLDKMPGYNVTLTEYNWSGNTYTWYYYIQVLPGETVSNPRTYDGKTFKLYRTSSLQAGGLVLTFDEDFYPIEGFNRYASVPAFSSWTSSGTADFDSNRKAYLYYSRASFSLEFFNYSYTLSTASILFETDISGMNQASPPKPAALTGEYNFGGWYTTDDCLDGSEFTWVNKKMPSHNIILYAKWTPVVYVVSFDLADPTLGHITHTENVNSGSAVSGMPATPTRDGYLFDGWYINQALTIRFIPTQQIYANTTVYAKWTPAPTSYTVEYRKNSTTGIKVWTDKYVGGVAVGTTVTETAIEIPGYTLDNLTSSPQSKTLVANATSNVIIFVYVPFSGYTYTVYYLKNGGIPSVPGDNLSPAANKTTDSSQVVEYFKYIPNYHPTHFLIQKTLSSVETNTITFYYDPYVVVPYKVRALPPESQHGSV